MKRRKDDRKPRSTEIRVDFGRPQVLSGMHEAPDGALTFFDQEEKPIAPLRIEVGQTYQRSRKRPKVLMRTAVLPETIQLDANRALLRFGFLVAVDTNTARLGETTVSVSVPAVITNLVVDAHVWRAGLAPNAALEFHDATVSPERIGWWDLIQRLQTQPELPRPIGVVVDSDLGRLAAFNARSEPLFDDVFVPDGIELIYGCGDRGTEEFVGNAAVAECDKIATTVMRKIAAGGLSSDYITPEHSLYRWSRHWTRS